MMAHASVKSVSRTSNGVEIDVVWHDGSRRIIVPDNASVIVSDPFDRSILKPGQLVTGVTRPGADSILRAGRLQLAPQ